MEVEVETVAVVTIILSKSLIALTSQLRTNWINFRIGLTASQDIDRYVTPSAFLFLLFLLLFLLSLLFLLFLLFLSLFFLFSFFPPLSILFFLLPFSLFSFLLHTSFPLTFITTRNYFTEIEFLNIFFL